MRVQSRSRMRLRIAASIAFLFRTCFKGVLDTIAPLSHGWAPPSGLERGGWELLPGRGSAKLLGFHGIFLFWCFHRIFLFWCKISHMRIQTYHHGASRICKNLQIFWPKTIVCKAIFYIFENKSTRIDLCKAIFYIFWNFSPKQRFMYVIVLAGKPLWPTTPKTQKTAKMTQDCNNVALQLPKISLSKGYFGQFKGYILCSGNVGGVFASEGGSCHRGFTIVLSLEQCFLLL